MRGKARYAPSKFETRFKNRKQTYTAAEKRANMEGLVGQDSACMVQQAQLAYHKNIITVLRQDTIRRLKHQHFLKVERTWQIKYSERWISYLVGQIMTH